MTTLEVTFAQTGDDLTVTNTPPAGDGLWLPEDGVAQIVRDLRRTYAPDSAYVPGKTLLAAVSEATSVTLTIYARADTSAALQALRESVEAAASQWSYALTITVDGVATVYNAEISLPAWSAFDSGMVRAHIDFCRLVIPVNP